jgi:REP element-mobilizing transposase RayT
MTSPSPLLFDTYYHIYNRGNNREDIFLEERNYDYFLRLYEKYVAPVAITYAYCLLKNHFHLAIRVKSEEEIIESLKVSETFRDSPGSRYVSDQFSRFFNAYAKAINKVCGRTGSLFQHPFGRVRIESGSQFWHVLAYIHQNPQKHKFVQDFRDWKYSSYGAVLTEGPTIIDREEVMHWFGTKEAYLALHSQWVSEAQAKRFAEPDVDD